MILDSVIEFILFFVAVASVILAATTSFYFKKKNLRLISEIGQLSVDKQILVEQLSKEIMKNQIVNNSDGFLKFVSDSRDWAFQYIEDAQVLIQSIVDKGSFSEEDIEELRKMLPNSTQV